MNSYWHDAELKARNKLLGASIDDLNKLIKEEYIQASKRVIRDLEAAYTKIISNPDPLNTHLYQYNRLYEQLAQIQDRMNKLSDKETNLFTQKLTDLYIDNQKITGASIGLYTKVDRETAEAAIKRIWVDDGLRFSDRIWQDKVALTEKLRQTLFDAVGTGKSPDTLTKEIMKEFNVSYNSAHRLVVTEMSHAATQSTIDKYKEAGIEKYKYIAESGCCEHCSDLNGKEFDISDEDHLPPKHPFANAVY